MAGGESARFQEQQIADLERRRIPYTVVSGPVEQRIARVEALLAGLGR